MKIVDIFNEHLYQFIITLVVISAYFVTNLNNRPTGIWESIVLVVCTFWFANATSRSTSTRLDSSIQEIANKVNSNTVKLDEVKKATDEVNKV